MSKSQRLQVLVEPEQQTRLSRIARARGVSVATVVRDAIDREIGVEGRVRREAARRILAATPITVPTDPADLEAEISGEYTDA